MVQSLQHVGHLAIDDAARQAFGDRRLADARIADEERIVLLPPAEDLDGAVDLRLAADQRIDASGRGLLVEVDAIGFERIGFGLLLAFRLSLARSAVLLVLARRRAPDAPPTARPAWRCHARCS